jgi:hypothetical protein
MPSAKYKVAFYSSVPRWHHTPVLIGEGPWNWITAWRLGGEQDIGKGPGQITDCFTSISEHTFISHRFYARAKEAWGCEHRGVRKQRYTEIKCCLFSLCHNSKFTQWCWKKKESEREEKRGRGSRISALALLTFTASLFFTGEWGVGGGSIVCIVRYAAASLSY